MNKACVECSRSISDRQMSVVCDMCKLPVHTSCTTLSHDDVKRVTRNTSKNLKFFCTKCADDNDKFASLSKLINNLVERMSQFEMNVAGPPSVTPKVFEELLSELDDRRHREKNILVFGLAEGENDEETINDIISSSCGDSNSKACYIKRLGNNQPGKSRPVKVTLSNSATARRILRNKNRLLSSSKFQRIKIKDDQTPRQRKYLLELRDELSKRIENGEIDLTIKYINRLPTIVRKDSVVKN